MCAVPVLLVTIYVSVAADERSPAMPLAAPCVVLIIILTFCFPAAVYVCVVSFLRYVLRRNLYLISRGNPALLDIVGCRMAFHLGDLEGKGEVGNQLGNAGEKGPRCPRRWSLWLLPGPSVHVRAVRQEPVPTPCIRRSCRFGSRYCRGPLPFLCRIAESPACSSVTTSAWPATLAIAVVPLGISR